MKKHAQAPSTREQAPSSGSVDKGSIDRESVVPGSDGAETLDLGAPKTSQSRTGKVAKPDSDLPPVPAADLSDRRRALNTI